MKPNLSALAWFAQVAATTGLANAEGAPTYEVSPRSLDAGGQRTTSANYTVDASLGGVFAGAPATGAAQQNRQGFIAQLYEVTSLAVSGPPTVAEGATGMFTATATLDDGTTLVVAPAQVAWSLTGAGQTIAATGEFFPANVYRDSAARVIATWLGKTSGADLLMLDALKDNFGPYGDDGLRDVWQVQYFGEDNSLAAPEIAAGGDGIVNQLKHAWNVAPADRANGPTFATVSGHLTLTFRRLKHTVTPRPSYLVQVSDDLVTWLDDTTGPYTTEISAVSLDSETELVTVRDNTPTTAKAQRFIRLRVSNP
jgi:hypothetical protein